MTLTDPIFVQLGIGMAILAVVGVWAHTTRRRALVAFLGGDVAAHRLTGVRLSRTPWERIFLLVTAILAASIAAAEPQWVIPPEDPPLVEVNSVVVALDVSASMQSGDAEPTRLARGVEISMALLDGLAQERVGILLFAGTGYPLAPPTEDHEALRYLLSGVVPTIASAHDPGTLMTEAIESALDLFGPQWDREGDRFIVLIGDGESNDAEETIQVAAAAADRGVRIFTVGVGTGEGSGMVMPAAPYQLGGVVVDEEGRPVTSRLQESSLTRVAELGGGSYRSADDQAGISDLVQTLSGADPSETPSSDDPRVPVDIGAWLAAAALLFLSLEGLLDVRIRGRLERRLRRHR